MEKLNQKLEALLELAILLGRQNDVQEALRVIAQTASVLFDADAASIFLTNPATEKTTKTIIRNGAALEQRSCRLAATAIAGWVMLNKQLFTSRDLQTDNRFRQDMLGAEVRAAMAAPLQRDSAIIGCLLVLTTREEATFDAQALRLLERMSELTLPFLQDVQQISAFFAPLLPEATLQARYAAAGLLGESRPFLELLRAVDAAARCDVRVLLEGQSGTGKELLARAIHRFSARGGGPFVAIDCGAIPENLMESELFGHVKGAFTGATSARKGLIEEADHGTLFLDEIANLPIDTQAKLLRVLQQGEVRAVGSNEPCKVDVRIISASSRSLLELIEKHLFREDLFYRLHVYPISVPSLDERSEDIPLFASHFLKKFSRQQQKRAISFDSTLLTFMQARSWAGNIRELENFVERLIALAPASAEILDEKVLPPELKKEFQTLESQLDDVRIGKSLKERLEAYERQILLQALSAHDWNQARAARALKIPQPTIRYKMSKLGIAKP